MPCLTAATVTTLLVGINRLSQYEIAFSDDGVTLASWCTASRDEPMLAGEATAACRQTLNEKT